MQLQAEIERSADGWLAPQEEWEGVGDEAEMPPEAGAERVIARHAQREEAASRGGAGAGHALQSKTSIGGAAAGLTCLPPLPSHPPLSWQQAALAP